MTFASSNERTKDFIKNINLYFKQEDNIIIQEGRNIIKKIEYQEKEYIVKFFREPNIINKIAYKIVKKSKAQKSYFNSLKISNFVPNAIGFIEFSKFGLLQDSYFISENFTYDFTIREALLDVNFHKKKTIFKTFAYFTFQLHQQNIYHLDYSPGNILIKEKDGQYTFKIVDINRMKFQVLDLETRLKNFAKLWAKDGDLEIIIREYAQLMNADEKNCIKIALHYSQSHKNFKNFKKRVRGEKVVD